VRVVLACSIGGGGHLEPVAQFGRALVAAGHSAVLLVPPALEPAARASGLEIEVGAEPPAAVVASIRERLARGPAAAVAGLVDRELFADRGTAAMLPSAHALLERVRPSLVLREATEYATAVAAVAHSIPFGTIAISQASIEHRVLEEVAPIVDGFGEGTSAAIGVAPFLSSFPDRLDPTPWPRTVRYRLEENDPTGLPDWWRGSTAPLVYVTFGTVVGHTSLAERVFRDAVDAVAPLPVRVLLTTGRAVDPSSLGVLPDHVHAERWVPQVDALAACAVVACHGGSGTTLGALRAGVPIVVCPLYADNARNGALVAGIGAGIVVETSRDEAGQATLGLRVDEVRAAVARVLAEPAFGDAAGRVRDEMATSPFPAAAVASLDVSMGP
jgi:UDP:flavonoid glycosyltransferase YjiC (YdhE family)